MHLRNLVQPPRPRPLTLPFPFPGGRGSCRRVKRRPYAASGPLGNVVRTDTLGQDGSRPSNYPPSHSPGQATPLSPLGIASWSLEIEIQCPHPGTSFLQGPGQSRGDICSLRNRKRSLDSRRKLIRATRAFGKCRLESEWVKPRSK